MSTHTIAHTLSAIDINHASHLLLAAGLGAALMAGANVFTLRHTLSINDFLNSQTVLQEAKIKELESDVESKDNELSRSLEENQSLNLLSQELNAEIEASRNEVNVLRNELVSVRSNLDKVQADKNILASHAEILSRCVFDGGKIRESTSTFFARMREAHGNIAKGAEIALTVNSMKEFHDSWTVGFCKDASGVAEQYYAY